MLFFLIKDLGHWAINLSKVDAVKREILELYHANFKKIDPTGLFITLAFWDKSFTDNTLYQKLLNDKMSTDLGYVYENIVAQMLVAERNELYYHTFQSETSHHKHEIDFLLSRDNKICPVEVKSSTYKRHASFDEFCKKFSSRILHKYLVYTKDLRKEQDVLYLPTYMAQFL